MSLVALRDFAFDNLNRARRVLGRSIFEGIAPFSADPAKRQELAAESSSELASLFYEHQGRVVRKWTHYLDLYDAHFRRFQGKPVKMLELGVSFGGSLELWRKFFGTEATIYGIDVDPECAQRVDPPNHVRIGSQADPAFLASVIDEMGEPDIILDDGSHIAEHQLASFRLLFPRLKAGGVYVIEDLHTAYWPGVHKGGHSRRGTAIDLTKTLIDDMHAWYHDAPTATPAKTDVAGIHVHDSIVFIHKAPRARPAHIAIPCPE
jgi:cephalosporin hydroxylase